MDITSLMLSMLFGAFGMGFVVYGRKATKVIPLVAGLALMVVPYFISNIIFMVLVCSAITAAPFLAPDL